MRQIISRYCPFKVGGTQHRPVFYSYTTLFDFNPPLAPNIHSFIQSRASTGIYSTNPVTHATVVFVLHWVYIRM
jgi:hypothetical protein